MGLSFAELTGRSDYERQSWRDSFHGGKPAGDWSGGVAARLEWERETYGATVSGSSREYSAAELWQIRASGDTGAIARDKSERRASQQGRSPASAGPGNPTVVSHKGPHPVPTTGPGVPAVAVGKPVPVLGAGAAAVATGPLKIKVKQTATGIVTGKWPWSVSPGWSNTDQWEERYGEPGDWLGGLVTMGADLGYNLKLAYDAARPGWASATPADKQEEQPRYYDGWVTYDEGSTWEKAGSIPQWADYRSF